jgi:hypothetical protein
MVRSSRRLANPVIRAFKGIACRSLAAIGIAVPQAWRELHIAQALLTAEKAYRPRFYSGKLVIFRGAGLYDHDPDLGWGTLAAHVESRAIGTGTCQHSHREIMNEPLVEELAREMSAYLVSSQQTPAVTTMGTRAHVPEVHQRARVGAGGAKTTT